MQLMWVSPVRGGWRYVKQSEWEFILGEEPSVTNTGEKWPLAYFDLPSRCFGFLGGGKVRFGTEESQFVEGRHLSPISGEGGLQPIVCCQPARSGESLFLTVSPGFGH